jgi:hypothetical protein
MQQVIDDQVSSYMARAERQEQKEAQTKLAKDMSACESAGYGVSYGKWKTTQPVLEVAEPEEELKVCPHCGEKFKPKVPYAKYCCPDHQKAAYSKNRKFLDRRKAYQAKYREKKKEEG